MRKESTRDHVDLLLSSKHWPLVYAVDMVCDVVAHVEIREPKLANAMWGNRRGCFQRPVPGIPPKVTATIFLIIVTGFGKTLRMGSARDSCNARF